MNRRAAILATVAIIAVTATIELAMGRIAYCKCGYVKAWHGTVMSAENSQHLSDWYTPSHVIHGLLLYALFWLWARRVPIATRFVMAVSLEAVWEVLENTPMVINRYREATIALDYFGDSVLNSIADILAMSAGFWIAAVAPLALSVTAAFAMELFVGFMIRDNLALNVIMLVYPLEAIKRWQSGG